IGLKVADVNGDGRPDALVVNYTGYVAVLLNTTVPGSSAPAFASKRTFASGNGPVSLAGGDVNGDGRPDVGVANPKEETVALLLNTTAPGAPTPTFASKATWNVANRPQSVAIIDVNSDGKPDLVVGDAVQVLLNTMAPGAATASFAPRVTLPFAADLGRV